MAPRSRDSWFAEVPVDGVGKAVDFYRRAFEASILETADDSRPAGAADLDLPGERGVLRLRVLDARTYVSGNEYDKGKTPRMEFRVDNVGEWLTRSIDAGATLRVRLGHDVNHVRSGSSLPMLHRVATNAEATYAHVIDPFGHLWAFALIEPDR